MSQRSRPSPERIWATIALQFLAIAIVLTAAAYGIFWLDLGPVIWVFSPAHGLHTGDLLIIAVATLLTTCSPSVSSTRCVP